MTLVNVNAERIRAGLRKTGELLYQTLQDLENNDLDALAVMDRLLLMENEVRQLRRTTPPPFGGHPMTAQLSGESWISGVSERKMELGIGVF